MEEHHITVERTARFHTLGNAAHARELWVVLHGYGQLARFFLRHFEGLEQGRLIVAPEALSRFYIDQGHSRVGATWMTREDREAEIADQKYYLNTLASHLLAQCPPGAALNVLGFSQGVATACRWAMAPVAPIRRLVLWGGSMAAELQATELGERWKLMEVVVVHGEQDALVPAQTMAHSSARLHDAGVPHRIIRFAGGHQLDRPTLQQAMGQVGV